MTARQRAIREKLRELEQKHGGLLEPKTIVEEAKAEGEGGILWAEFEWDNDAAAEKYRLDQARELMRSVSYQETVLPQEYKTPRYVHVVLDNKPGYMDIDRVKLNKELSKATLGDEVKRARAALERARGVADVLGLREDLESALRWLVALQEKAA